MGYPWQSWGAHASTNLGTWVSLGQHCLRLCEPCLGKLRRCRGATLLLDVQCFQEKDVLFSATSKNNTVSGISRFVLLGLIFLNCLLKPLLI